MPMKPTTHLSKQSKGSACDRFRGSSADRGYDHTWRKLRLQALIRDMYVCQMCGKPAGKSAHVDHIIPKSRGGKDEMSNLQTLHAVCHQRKTNSEAKDIEH